MAIPDEPLTRTEQYVNRTATGGGTIPEFPLTRVEQYLNKIATGSGDTPEQPLTRMEQYLDYIAENGSGSGGGDPYEIARALIANTLTEYIDDSLTEIRRGAFVGCTNLTTIQCHNVEQIPGTQPNEGPFTYCGVTKLAFPKLTAVNGNRIFEASTNLQQIDLGETFTSVPAVCFFNCGRLNTIILRSATLCPLGNVNAFGNTPFKSGGIGGTIYIPKSLYDHLGDGTSLDYKAATNWSTMDGYGTITWAQIEGSIYETKYADGTTIPTA